MTLLWGFFVLWECESKVGTHFHVFSKRKWKLKKKKLAYYALAGVAKLFGVSSHKLIPTLQVRSPVGVCAGGR